MGLYCINLYNISIFDEIFRDIRSGANQFVSEKLCEMSRCSDSLAQWMK
jgi:hypothetical protein